MASCNIDTLISSACTNRFDCIDQQLYEAIRLQLLCDLTVSGTGGGNPQVLLYDSPATPETPDDPTKPAIAYEQSGNGPIFGWNVAAQKWN